MIIEDGTTNRAFLLAILDRPEFKAGEVDIAWLDRMGVSGEMEADGGADAALLAAAIELADHETATERASFYAFARRGRPEATAQVSRAVEVRHRGQAYRIVVAQLAPAATGPTSTAPRSRSTSSGSPATSAGSRSPAPRTAR